VGSAGDARLPQMTVSMAHFDEKAPAKMRCVQPFDADTLDPSTWNWT
jgi:hypothetical protein